MTKVEAERLLNKYLKRYDKKYKSIVEILSGETKFYFVFLCKYKTNNTSCEYVVVKKTGDVVLVPT